MKGRGIGKGLRRIATTLLVLLVCAVWVAPSLIARTDLRNSIAQAALNVPEWSVSSESVSLGWLSPVKISGVDVSDREGAFHLTIDQVVIDRSWWSLWLSPEDLGSLQVTGPRLELAVNSAAPEQDPDAPFKLPLFDAELRDASVLLYDQTLEGDVSIRVDGLDAGIQSTESSQGRQIVVDHVTVFKEQLITPEICDHGLQLIAPVLDGEVSVSGSVTLELSELLIPLGVDEEEFVSRLQVKGSASLHDVEASVINPVTRGLVDMFSELLNLGRLPERIRLTDETQLQFDVREGRIFHESSATLVPGVTEGFEFQTSGLVSLDETVELDVSIRLPIEVLGDGPLARKVAETFIELSVVGSISEPVFRIAEDAQWVQSLEAELNAKNLSPSDQELADDLRKLIAELQGN